MKCSTSIVNVPLNLILTAVYCTHYMWFYMQINPVSSNQAFYTARNIGVIICLEEEYSSVQIFSKWAQIWSWKKWIE